MTVRNYFKRHFVSLSFLALSCIAFFLINQGSTLPSNTLEQFGFSAAAPPWQWLYRTFTSDWLYLNSVHFTLCVLPLFLLIQWGERTHSLKFLATFLFAVSFFDDYLNYFLILKPFQFVRPELYHLMVAEKDVGSSLIVSALLGLQIVQYDRYREFIFVFLSIAFVMVTVFSTTHYSTVVLNLNHFIFLCLGYAVGKIKVIRNRKSGLVKSGRLENLEMKG